jgi:hypothetical protein
VPRVHVENDVASPQSEKTKQKSSNSDVKRLIFAQNSRDPPEFSYLILTLQRRGYGGTMGSPVREGKKNYFWIPYPTACFSASSEPVLVRFQGFLTSKHVNNPHGVILMPIKCVAGLGVKRTVCFVKTMVVDYPRLHFFVCYIILDGK